MASLRKHKRKPSFFKVLIRDFSTRLQIPPAFIKEFGKDVPEKTTLETYNGKSWEVGVEKLGNKFYFNNGWDKFVQVNSLENGDFLVLKYFADYSKFKVKIYGKTCCEKPLNVVIGERSSKPPNGKQDQRNEQERRKRKRNEEEEEDDDDEDGESKAFKVEVIKLDPVSSSSFDDADDDGEQEIGGTQKRKANKNYGKMPADHHNHIEFKSENDDHFFQCKLTNTTAKFYLHIPFSFFKEHIKEDKRIKLKVSKRTWNLEIHACRGRKDARVTKKWNTLVKKHNLKKGDVCVFEMIKTYDSVFHVHVYRWDHQIAQFSKII